MRIVALVGEQPNQIALCNKLAAVCELSAVVLSANVPRRRPSIIQRARRALNGIAVRMVGRRYVAAWRGMLARYAERYPSLPPTDVVHVRNVNDDATLQTIERHRPDLVIVSGTNLVGRRVIQLAQNMGGILNLHTGISPYVKGGPNCTNWCLSEGTFHLIGNTVMWLDPGIDSGNIVATEATELTGREDLNELHWKVMEHAHDLYVRIVRAIATGHTVQAIAQNSIADGRTYYTREWDGRAMKRGLRRFDEEFADFFSDGARVRQLRRDLVLVSPEEVRA